MKSCARELCIQTVESDQREGGEQSVSVCWPVSVAGSLSEETEAGSDSGKGRQHCDWKADGEQCKRQLYT